MISANEKAWERLQITEQMLCRKEFSIINCKNCDYFYYKVEDGYRISSCLKKNIRDWTLYRIDKGYGGK